MEAADARPQRRRLALPLLAAAASYLALHGAALGVVPPGVASDPVIEAMRGLRLVLERRFEVLTFSIGPSAETLYLYPLGASVALLGPTRLALALPSALAATAVLALLALVVRRARPALSLAVPLLLGASSVWLFHYGQVGLRAISAPLFVLGAVLLLDDTEGSGLAKRPFAAGALLGLSIYAYSGCRLLPLAYAAHLSWRTLRRAAPRAALFREALRVGAGFLVASIPNLLFLLRAPSLFLDRGYYVARGDLADKLVNVLATFLLPFGYPDRYRVWRGAGHVFDATGVALTASDLDPLDLVAGPLAVLGLAVLLFGKGRRISNGLSFLVAVWLTGGVLLGAFGPGLTRLLILLPAWLVFAALGAEALLARAPALRLPLVAFLFLWLGLRADAYVRTFGPSTGSRWEFHEAITAMAERARDLTGQGTRVLVVSRRGRDVFKYFGWRRIEQIYHVPQPSGVPEEGDVPLHGFRPGVVLVERTPDLDRWAPPGGVAGPSPKPALYAEYHLPDADPSPPTVRSNLWRLWSPIAW